MFDHQLHENSALLLLNCQFHPHEIRNVEGEAFLNLALCDTMGLSGQNGAGPHSGDIVSIIGGHVPDGYQVNFIANARRSSDSSSFPDLKESSFARHSSTRPSR